MQVWYPKLTGLFFCFGCVLAAFGQDTTVLYKSLGFEKIKDLKIVSSIHYESYFSRNRNNYFLAYNTKKGMKVARFEGNYIAQTINIRLPKWMGKRVKTELEHYVKTVTVQDSGLLSITTWDRTIHIFKFKNAEYQYVNSHELINDPYKVIYIKGFWYLCFSYNYHPNNAPEQAWIDMWNADFTATKHLRLPLAYPEVTYYAPYSYFDSDGENIYYTDPAQPKVYRISKGLTRLDSIDFGYRGWIYMDSSTHQRIWKTQFTPFFQGYKVLDSLVMDILSINRYLFVNVNEHELVVFSEAYSDKYPVSKCHNRFNFTYRVKFDDQFKAISIDTVPETNCLLEGTKVMNDGRYPFWSYTNTHTGFSNGIIYQLNYSTPFDYSGLSYREYYQKKQKYFVKNKPVATIWYYAY